jgi:hypothetical protein
MEQKISVKERMQKFNRIASEGEMPLVPKQQNGTSKNRRDAVLKHESADYDTASLSSYGYGFHAEPKGREWILTAVRLDYPALNKLAQENPSLVKRRDINGYTALHWAAKAGHVELVKLLAGTYRSDVNAKSNGGYTPLHLSSMFGRQEVYDILVKTYNADANMRDHSGKKPMQYMVRQDSTAVSMDTFKKIKEKRRSTELQRDRERDRERDSSFLRIGSLNVRVKRTTEAFGQFLGKSPSASSMDRSLHKSWGSADNLPESEAGHDKDKEMMPPPGAPTSRGSSKSRKVLARRSLQIPPGSETSSIQETQSDSDSDTACGFGSEWNN